jgi:very-short-patch-repair endonuclease
LSLQLLGAVALERRRFVAGNSAQFQGDERDVMLLSMVDVPTGTPLRLLQTDAFKQRYNVATSRARDQMWLVHSLDPARDLKAGDLRRELIMHVAAPESRRSGGSLSASRAPSRLELAVMERLVAAGFGVEAAVSTGYFRIGLVVSDARGRGQIAVECDGERRQGLDQLSDDLERQAVLERAGWRFVRVRGTRFYRDPDDTMARLAGMLRSLGVQSASAGKRRTPAVPVAAAGHRDRVVRLAWELMEERGWLRIPEAGSADEPSGNGVAHGDGGTAPRVELRVV